MLGNLRGEGGEALLTYNPDHARGWGTLLEVVVGVVWMIHFYWCLKICIIQAAQKIFSASFFLVFSVFCYRDEQESVCTRDTLIVYTSRRTGA